MPVDKSIFRVLDKKILKKRLNYYFLKIAPKGLEISIELKNNLKYKLRGRSSDKTVFKEIWLNHLYNQFGVKVESGDTVVDVGAHVGIFATYAAEHSKTGKVYSFEPFIENYKRLQFHKKVNNKDQIVPFNYGISGDAGTKFLYINSKNSGGNSLFKGESKKEKVKIETLTLKEFCVNQNIKTIDFLKIDCEGAEYNIFNQDHSFLKGVKKIIMESHPIEGNSVFDILETLKSYGFKIHNENEIISDKELNMVYASK